MPRRIREVKVIAVNDGKNPVKYLTEDRAVYEKPDDFIRYLLAEPHRERYDIRYSSDSSYELCSSYMPHVREEEFGSMIQYMAKFSPYNFYDPDIYMKYFDVLWEGGCVSPC